MNPNSVPPEYLEAVLTMASVIPYFPCDDASRVVIAKLISQFVKTKAQLDWLTFTACGHMRDWEKSGGVVELRGLFCSRYRPADGVYANANTLGFTADDLEAKFLQQEIEENTKRLESSGADFKRIK